MTILQCTREKHPRPLYNTIFEILIYTPFAFVYICTIIITYANPTCIYYLYRQLHISKSSFMQHAAQPCSRSAALQIRKRPESKNGLYNAPGLVLYIRAHGEKEKASPRICESVCVQKKYRTMRYTCTTLLA